MKLASTHIDPLAGVMKNLNVNPLADVESDGQSTSAAIEDGDSAGRSVEEGTVESGLEGDDGDESNGSDDSTT